MALESKARFHSSTRAIALLCFSPLGSVPRGPVLILRQPGKKVVSMASGIIIFIFDGQFSAIRSSCSNNASKLLVTAISASGSAISEKYHRSHRENHTIKIVPFLSAALTRLVTYCCFSNFSHCCTCVLRSARGLTDSCSASKVLLEGAVLRVLIKMSRSTTAPLYPLSQVESSDLAKLSW